MPLLFENARLVDLDGERPGWLLVDGDTITATGTGSAPDEVTAAAAERIDVAGAWLAPGFIDLHGHGGGGFAFDDGPESIRAALATHRAHGTTRSVISLVANPLDTLTASLRTVAELVASDPLILGSHLEGPYLAVRRRGAHAQEFLIAPDAEVDARLLEAANGTLRQITIAPELEGALESIDRYTAAGAVVAIGHTEVDYETARQAFAHGARLLTHAYNAMPGIHHRDPGPLVAAFDDPNVAVELVADGIHVHPGVLEMTFRAAPNRIVLVTDAMAAAGSAEGFYSIGSLNVVVKEGRAVLNGTDTLAGSTLTLDVALRTAIVAAQTAPADAVAALTSTPARVLGLDDRLGRLAPGFAADLVVLDDEWTVDAVWARGERVPV
ncbi:N-acetylglucosamine-6-phosphate deacetylase [uncultured Schumannella sp.]|uniref:N-acetylglucosamine-6-phosphate deacetylase n=1 Tax=uncultured Schumannella sp. TaxID=1195956 RepID=UPI0025E8E05A|nr:N-acetylglucosamine-6-phosphate deacetylase [uncultured Schumannella sp.]